MLGSQPNPGPRSGPLADLRTGFHLLRQFARGAALPLEVWVRRPGTWGDRHLGPAAAFGLVWPVLFLALAGPGPGGEGVFVAWAATAAMLLVHRAAGERLRRQGYACHSDYVGESRFEGGRRNRPADQAHNLEVMAGLAAAVLALFAGSPPLAGLLVVATLGHGLTLGLAHRAVAARLRAMKDAELEAAFYADRYRGQSGGRHW